MRICTYRRNQNDPGDAEAAVRARKRKQLTRRAPRHQDGQDVSADLPVYAMPCHALAAGTRQNATVGREGRARD